MLLLPGSPDSLFLWYANLRFRVKRSSTRFSRHPLGGFVARDNFAPDRVFVNKKRGYWVYKNGVSERGDFLWQSYALSNVQFGPEDVVIDCGANAGDLFINLSGKISDFNYVAVEPNPDDFSVLVRNVPGARARQFALGAKDSQATLYVQSSRADSSLIQPTHFTGQVTVAVRALDSLIREEGLSKIRLLKIEAEGFEPEILRGAEQALALTDFVAIDGGPERGINREVTFCDVSNFLYGRGFELVEVYFPWHRALFRRST